ncbi:MAG: hypothetical protein HC836_32365 [Richelia sp. RM2_1_2]|nr:hypothetical protein [Richelia sp. SM2_1_7]NJM20510.1 hypothetical protein [Richelia sp. SM1_7_0]NJN11789.1 hypothetical protein [Richelia sp. RM1_1_1]NJO29450.1 hypothetical protein [Richelia sp. SL_2_1]NJO62755.1 hypothetical protein [Richelia sp. RM2_1_2]
MRNTWKKSSLIGTITLVSSLSFVDLVIPPKASASVEQKAINNITFNAGIEQLTTVGDFRRIRRRRRNGNVDKNLPPVSCSPCGC